MLDLLQAPQQLLQPTRQIHQEFRDSSQAPATLSSIVMKSLTDQKIFLHQTFAAGRVFTNSLLDLLMAQAYFSPSEILFWEALVGIGRPGNSYGDVFFLENGKQQHAARICYNHGPIQLKSIFVPEGFVGKEYRILADCARDAGGRLCLGLFRPQDKDGKDGKKGNEFPYMLTNPDKDEEIIMGDMVLLLEPPTAPGSQQEAETAPKQSTKKRSKSQAPSEAEDNELEEKEIVTAAGEEENSSSRL